MSVTWNNVRIEVTAVAGRGVDGYCAYRSQHLREPMDDPLFDVVD